jgi:hypothetical protein
MSDTENERIAFEQWHRDTYKWPDGTPAGTERDGDGYKEHWTQFSWESWKARAQLAVPVAAPEPKLSVPPEDDDPDETNLAQHIREGFEAEKSDDALSSIEEILAWEYFAAGWKRAIAKYAAQPAPSERQPVRKLGRVSAVPDITPQDFA